MDKLETLKIADCKALVEFPKIEAKMDSLVKLSLCEVGIEVLPSTIGEHCTNLTSLMLRGCSKLKSIEGSFHALKGLQDFRLVYCQQFEKFPKDISNENLDGLGLRKLDLSYCGLKNGEIPKELGELSNLQELDLSGNCFTRLDFSLSRLTSLKLLDLSFCKNLVELPELPSSLAVLCAIVCISLEAIVRDDIPINCKCLCYVSIDARRSNPIGGERLLETMLQGAAVESRCMTLLLNDGSEIARVFGPDVVRGKRRCRMELPENWYNEFYGFLFFTASCDYMDPSISMKHVEKSVGDDACWEEETVDNNNTWVWVGYFPFSLLGDTSWWDPTSTALEVDFHNLASFSKIKKCGWKLVPKRGAAAECSETTPTTYSSDDDDDYKCKLRILHDSKSAIEFEIQQRWL